ncbi:MAG TPA: glycosyltransferase [Blastocatellia bacterium]|nr:glycosyltransferase [Blastocatellia bacterium]
MLTLTELICFPPAACLCLVVVNVLFWPKVRRSGHARPRSVSLLVPARNEEKNLPECLDAVLRQGDVIAEVLIYDDHSTDHTTRIIGEYARRDGRIRRVPAVPLEPGWCGKNFACAQLAAAARGEWILFIDADARLTDGAAARMLAEAEARKLTFLSCWPGLDMRSFWEKVLMPLLNFAVFTLYPAPLALRRPETASLGLAHGACMLFHRADYEAFGGHAVVRDEIFEDTVLARLWRASGRRGLGLDGQDVVRVRMYTSLGGIWQGFQKNFFPAFRRQSSFWLFLLFHLVIFLLPFVLLIAARNTAIVSAALGVLLIRLLLALRFRHPLWSVLLHPLGETVLILIGLFSWWKCQSGRGVEWKGRQYQTTEVRSQKSEVGSVRT